MRTPFSSRALLLCMLAVVAVMLPACSATTSGRTIAAASPSPASTPTSTSVPTRTPLPLSPCTRYVPGSTLVTAINGVKGIKLPKGTYGNAGTHSGGGTGQYSVTMYTLCFHGTEADIDGGPMPPHGSPTSTIGYLVQAGWVLNNLFPDPKNAAYLDFCSTQHICVNSTGSGSPFTFAGFDQYASHSGGYTTFHLQVATIAAPSCLNDPQYYSGTPKYTLYEDGSSASSINPTYHFQMPPGTRVSTFQGGGTAGSTYVYFCSRGTQASVVAFLKQAMQNVGYMLSSVTSSGFSAALGSSPTYRVDVQVANPNNYYLRVYVPM